MPPPANSEQAWLKHTRTLVLHGDHAGVEAEIPLALRQYLRSFELRRILTGICSMVRMDFPYHRLVRLAGSGHLPRASARPACGKRVNRFTQARWGDGKIMLRTCLSFCICVKMTRRLVIPVSVHPVETACRSRGCTSRPKRAAFRRAETSNTVETSTAVLPADGP